jgi:hypothetical protein
MGKLFVSYRRDDSIGMAGRIYDRLAAHFGGDAVFMDVDAIPFGVDFRQHLSNAVSGCDALLAIIGEDWLSISREGERRLDDPKDFVRIEIEAAFQQSIPVIPVLIEPARMPQEEELPEPLRDLAYRNAATVDPGRDFHSHVDRLIRGVDDLLRVDPRGKTSTGIREFERSITQLRDDAEEALLRIAQVAARGGRVGDQEPIERVTELAEQGVLPKELAGQLSSFLSTSRTALAARDLPHAERESLLIGGASLVPVLRRHCKVIEMEREFDAHGLWHMRSLRPKEVQRYYSWSAVAASAPEFDYDYDIYCEAAERHNQRLIDQMGEESAAKGLIDILDLREYVEVLQFRESEIRRVLAAYEVGQDAFSEAIGAWLWPKEWGDVGWNGQVVHGWLRDVERELTRTRKALQLYRQRLDTVA